ncbi:MAG TPA: PfkB family carbohydrate kinase [Mycobacterium sp.]|uniref:PfkB family carbohydrate kinase n=1 Tax=Mycobacterium sp. TaxID=1785 RepID=UPI002D180A09|nr:PfkB family carbohydrate kinase [Mycobacterium sp.]HME80392.1 PfkB family carbohydrate kinase [Mycobacterium sp.]
MSKATSPNGSRAKILTLTMNPALDITTSVHRVRPTDELRCQGARHDPGGGGINVARIARVLGASAAAVFPAGGPTGAVVADLLVGEGVPFHRVSISGGSSINSQCLTIARHLLFTW